MVPAWYICALATFHLPTAPVNCPPLATWCSWCPCTDRNWKVSSLPSKLLRHGPARESRHWTVVSRLLIRTFFYQTALLPVQFKWSPPTLTFVWIWPSTPSRSGLLGMTNLGSPNSWRPSCTKKMPSNKWQSQGESQPNGYWQADHSRQTKLQSKLEDKFKRNDPRQYWKAREKITGYKARKSQLQTGDDARLAKELNSFYTRFDMYDFSDQQKEVMERVGRDQSGSSEELFPDGEDPQCSWPWQH